MVSVRSLVPGQGTLTLLVPQPGIPALRLLQHHAPNLGIECLDHKGNPVLVSLVNLGTLLFRGGGGQTVTRRQAGHMPTRE